MKNKEIVKLIKERIKDCFSNYKYDKECKQCDLRQKCKALFWGVESYEVDNMDKDIEIKIEKMKEEKKKLEERPTNVDYSRGINNIPYTIEGAE